VTAVSDAVSRRRSHSSVTTDAPSHDELVRLVEAVSTVADHGSMRPWRLIELRGSARERLGAAFVASSGLTGSAAEKLAQKPLRAPLLIAVVARVQPTFKVAGWEQEAVASGVAHLMSLMLDEAGWGVMWRTGVHTRSETVHELHGLSPDEHLLGWLYVGGKKSNDKPEKKLKVDISELISVLD
jgi:nitroreductase